MEQKNNLTMSKPMQIVVGLSIVVLALFFILPGEKDEPKQISRSENIDKAFSALDGSHIKLKQYVKDNMNDPESFEAVKTEYWDQDTVIVVKMVFTGKNAFGGRVKQTVMANCDINGEVLKIIASK
jgi:hypothetical protein